MASSRTLYNALLDRFGPEIAAAFADAISDLRSNADLSALTSAISNGDIDAALSALNLSPVAFADMLDVIQRAYSEGGRTAVAKLPTLRDQGAVVVVRFDTRNPRAEAWLREESSTLVTRILDEQRVAIRAALTAGMERGENPRTTALDIVGRIDKATGRRQGGIVGLTVPHEQAVRAARDELTSGDPATMTRYFERARRDKRFDRSVQRAISDEKPVPPETLAKIERSYKNRLLQLRGEMIGRTESLTALRASRREAYLQAVDTGAIAASSVRRTWRDSGDSRVRHSHAVMDSQTVGLNEPYVSPSGALLMYPGDPRAPASERIACRCDEVYRIDFLADLD